jgi:hypothetical protein
MAVPGSKYSGIINNFVMPEIFAYAGTFILDGMIL